MLSIVILAEVASAEAAKVSGGMSILSPDLITALFSGLAMVLGAVGALIWGNHNTEKKIAAVKEELKIANDPLNVNRVDKPVTTRECREYRCQMEKRIDEIGPALGRVFTKLDENNKASEARTAALHARIDPLLARVAENQGEVRLLKDIVVGKKERRNDERAA